MGAQWLVAKYMRDLRRRETRNIGVILMCDGAIRYRFLGMRPDDSIDGRRIKWGGDAQSYKGWVSYWVRTLRREGAEGISRLMQRHGDESYIIEFGGQRVVGASPDPDVFVDQLFGLLVEEEIVEADLTVEDLAESAFNRLNIKQRVQRDEEVMVRSSTGAVDKVRFHYLFRNGSLHVMQRISLTYEDPRAWDAIHAAIYAFERSNALSAGPVHPLALVRCRPEDNELKEQLGRIEDSGATVIDMGRPDSTDELRDQLHVEAA